jgi:hypothetical protein
MVISRAFGGSVVAIEHRDYNEVCPGKVPIIDNKVLHHRVSQTIPCLKVLGTTRTLFITQRLNHASRCWCSMKADYCLHEKLSMLGSFKATGMLQPHLVYSKEPSADALPE